MGDLAIDTAVRGTGDSARFTAELSPDWEIWGPMGGYVAGVAVRAAGAVSPFRRPASFACQYLGVASFATVDIEVVTLRAARTACGQRVSMSQEGRPILEALVWSVGEVDGLEHHDAEPPDVPPPEELRSFEELRPDGPPFAFWNNVEARPVRYVDWPPPGPLSPVWQAWTRFRPTAVFDDPWVDAARSLILVDVQSWPSASLPHAWKQPAYIAPSLDLYVAFHEPATDTEWLLADGYGPTATGGLMGWTGRLWSPAGRLVASGGGQALCRRLPGAS